MNNETFPKCCVKMKILDMIALSHFAFLKEFPVIKDFTELKERNNNLLMHTFVLNLCCMLRLR